LRSSRLDPMQAIKSAGPNSSTGRGDRNLLRGVVVTQTALTLALLVAAGLLIRTMNNLANVQTGYETGRILTMTVTEVERAKWMDFHTQALERVAKLPGVQNVAFAWGVPLTGNSWTGTVLIEGQPVPVKPSDELTFPLRAITEDYFSLLGLPVLQGRAFRATDKGDKLNVAIVNQAFIDRYFPNTASVGKKLWLFSRDQPPAEIVGVVGNTRTNDLTKSAEPEIYLSLWQANAFSKHLVVRTSADPRTLVLAVQRELHAIDPTAAVENIKTLEQIRSDSTASKTFATQLLVGFSVVASVLTLVGIYGVLSLSVAARRREIAIRSAVGAQKRDILGLILGEGLRLIAGGVTIGLLTAILLSWVLSSFLFGVNRNDPLTLIAVGLLFTIVALVACWLPARRASKVDPMVALRYE
jgi:putative ABC transport system permease protein